MFRFANWWGYRAGSTFSRCFTNWDFVPDPVLVRRDKIVVHVQGLIDEWGEALILFDQRPPTDTAPWAGMTLARMIAGNQGPEQAVPAVLRVAPARFPLAALRLWYLRSVCLYYKLTDDLF